MSHYEVLAVLLHMGNFLLTAVLIYGQYVAE